MFECVDKSAQFGPIFSRVCIIVCIKICSCCSYFWEIYGVLPYIIITMLLVLLQNISNDQTNDRDVTSVDTVRQR
jgi:hypothetical protein